MNSLEIPGATLLPQWEAPVMEAPGLSAEEMGSGLQGLGLMKEGSLASPGPHILWH